MYVFFTYLPPFFRSRYHGSYTRASITDCRCCYNCITKLPLSLVSRLFFFLSACRSPKCGKPDLSDTDVESLVLPLQSGVYGIRVLLFVSLTSNGQHQAICLNAVRYSPLLLVFYFSRSHPFAFATTPLLLIILPLLFGSSPSSLRGQRFFVVAAHCTLLYSHGVKKMTFRCTSVSTSRGLSVLVTERKNKIKR